MEGYAAVLTRDGQGGALLREVAKPEKFEDNTCEQNTLTRHIFSCFTAHISMSYVTLAQGVMRARRPCIIRMLLLS